MTMMMKAGQALAGTLISLAMLAVPAAAQTPGKPGLVNPNTASESELAQLPNMTPAVAQSVVAKRPFKTPVELNRVCSIRSLRRIRRKRFMQGLSCRST